MKITVHFEGSIFVDGKQKIFANDVRRYIGSIVSDKYKDTFLWHERSPAPFIYLKPYKDYFEILTYKIDAIDAIEHLISRITLNPNIKLNGLNLKVSKVTPRDTTFNVIKEGSFRYKTRTPIIIGASKTEHAIYNSLKNNEEAMKEHTKKLIIDSVKYQIREYYGEEFDHIDDLELYFIDFKHFTTRYYHDKEYQYHPAVWCEFISTFSLPQMLGYKFGMGFGHIVPVREKKVA